MKILKRFLVLKIFIIKDEKVTDSLKSCGSQASTPSSSRDVITN